METKELFANAITLVGSVESLDQLLALETALKEYVKARKETFKEEVKTEAKAVKEEAKKVICVKLADAKLGDLVKYTFGSGKAKEVRIGKLTRIPTADKPSFSVECDDGKGGVKKLPRNADAFIGMVA